MEPHARKHGGDPRRSTLACAARLVHKVPVGTNQTPGGGHMMTAHRRFFGTALTTGIVAIALIVAVGGSEIRGFDPAATVSATGPIHLSASQLEQWRAETATPFERAAVVDKLQAAFSGVAEVGSGPLPRAAVPAETWPSSAHEAHEDLAIGITGDHFWIIASYADIVRGAIATAIVVCVNYGVPGWLCSSAGYLLATWSADWGYASNHGVWAAVYWWPPAITGGRW